MGSEAGLWTTVKKNMKNHWEPQRVENAAGPGTPDVYYTLNSGIGGWVELKHAHKWPKNSNTALKIEHFTPQQRSWLRRHGKLGANVFVLLQVENQYFLLDWNDAQNIGGEYWNSQFSTKEWTRGDYESLATKWFRSIDYSELIFLLS